MSKHEIRVEMSRSEDLRKVIEKAYFEDGLVGKIMGKENFIVVDEEDDINHIIFRGLNNSTAKITNDDVIDGAMRFLVDETQGEIRLYPISIYCIKEEDKYSFY